MKVEMKQRTRVAVIAAVVCLMVACLSLAACGGSSSSSAASSSAASSAASSSAASTSASASSASASASASASSSAASGAVDFTGTWKLAAAESQGITMGGNFGEMMGMSEDGNLTLNADGTGKMALGDVAGDLTWAPEGADSIYVTPQGEEASIQQAILVTYQDGALFMPIEQDGQTVTVIFTRDGNYAGAKQITLDGATPITSESQLLGTWTLVGLNMGGISMYGEPEAMNAAMGSGAATLTFKEGGAIEQESGEATWAIDANGATMTSTDITGTKTVPIVAIDDQIAIDYSGAYGMEFILLMAKA